MKSMLIIFCFLFVSASAVADDIKLPEKQDAAGFRSVLADAGKAYISGQPTEEGLKRLASEGVTVVINFRTAQEMSERVNFDEAATVEALGMKYVNIPLGGDEHPYGPSALVAFAEALKHAKGKALVHCASAYRASHMWTAYLAKYEGLEINEAISHGRAANMGTPPVETLLGGVTYTLKEPDKN